MHESSAELPCHSILRFADSEDRFRPCSVGIEWTAQSTRHHRRLVLPAMIPVCRPLDRDSDEQNATPESRARYIEGQGPHRSDEYLDQNSKKDSARCGGRAA